MSNRMTSAAVLVAALAVGGTAYADLSKGVISAFKGQLIVSKGELPAGKSDKDTITKIKAAQLKELTGDANEDVTYWNFHYTAFLSKPGASALTVKFFADGKRFVADKRLEGIDPKSSVLEGDLSINEDEGLAKGKSYVVKLVTEKDAVVAQTTLLMK